MLNKRKRKKIILQEEWNQYWKENGIDKRI